MIITCPNCSTRYNIQPAMLGGGRGTRCFNCGHSWFQQPVVSPPPPPMRPPSAQQTGMMPAIGYPQQAMGYPPQMAPYPGQYPGPHPGQPMANYMGGTQPMPQPAPAPKPQPEPEPEIEEVDFDAALAIDDDDDDEMEAAPSPAAMADEDDEDEDQADDSEGLSQAELDAMFGENDEPAPVESLVVSLDEADDDLGDDIDPKDLPEPEPIPRVFSPDEDEEEPAKRSLLKTILIVVAVLLVALLAGLFFARGMVMDMLPFTKGIYSAIGLGEKIGAGLKIGDAKPRRATVRGKEALIVEGVITNVSEDTRQVPMVKVALRDGENHELQSAMSAPIKSELKAGERIKFKVTLIEPSPLARRVEVVFAAAEEAKEGAKKPAH